MNFEVSASRLAPGQISIAAPGITRLGGRPTITTRSKARQAAAAKKKRQLKAATKRKLKRKPKKKKAKAKKKKKKKKTKKKRKTTKRKSRKRVSKKRKTRAIGSLKITNRGASYTQKNGKTHRIALLTLINRLPRRVVARYVVRRKR